jgi:predicted nucleic acid-binding protein
MCSCTLTPVIRPLALPALICWRESSGDALIVAMMQANGLTKLASNDADFDRVPGITRFSPV